jgi:hypothetical protein
MWADAGPLVAALGSKAVVLILAGDLIGFGLALFARRRGLGRGKYHGRLIPVTIQWGEEPQDRES